MLKVYDGLAAGIRCDDGLAAGIIYDAIIGKELVINGGTYIYNRNLDLTGDINKGTFNVSSGAWAQKKKLNDYFVIRGVKTTHCLDINNSTE
jgi:hypothetical protein